jgi:hypothetical protein
MGAVLKFPPRSGPARPALATRRAAPAEILVFTGVRYERWDDAEAATAAEVPDAGAARADDGKGRPPR